MTETRLPPQALDDLERKAKAATPGPWKAAGLQYGCFYILTEDESGMVADDAPDAEAAVARLRGYGAGLPMKANAEHIAANSPDVTLALIDRLREQDAEIARLKDLLVVAAPMLCAECGPHVAIDEDGCCATCGADTTYITPPEKGARNTHD